MAPCRLLHCKSPAGLGTGDLYCAAHCGPTASPICKTERQGVSTLLARNCLFKGGGVTPLYTPTGFAVAVQQSLGGEWT